MGTHQGSSAHEPKTTDELEFEACSDEEGVKTSRTSPTRAVMWYRDTSEVLAKQVELSAAGNGYFLNPKKQYINPENGENARLYSHSIGLDLAVKAVETVRGAIKRKVRDQQIFWSGKLGGCLVSSAGGIYYLQ